MAIPYQITDRVTPELRRLTELLASRIPIHNVVARGEWNLFREHFAKLTDTNRNKFGARSSFWPRMRRLTRHEADAESARVVMPREVAQRYHGGTITPKGGRKALTIPVHPKAYGKRAGEFDDLQLIPQQGAGRVIALLVKRNAKRAIGEVYYLLVKKVTQRGNTNVLPAERDIDRTAGQAIEALLRRRNQ